MRIGNDANWTTTGPKSVIGIPKLRYAKGTLIGFLTSLFRIALKSEADTRKTAMDTPRRMYQSSSLFCTEKRILLFSMTQLMTVLNNPITVSVPKTDLELSFRIRFSPLIWYVKVHYLLELHYTI
jgi:hypothetical protein